MRKRDKKIEYRVVKEYVYLLAGNMIIKTRNRFGLVRIFRNGIINSINKQ